MVPLFLSYHPHPHANRQEALVTLPSRLIWGLTTSHSLQCGHPVPSPLPLAWLIISPLTGFTPLVLVFRRAAGRCPPLPSTARNTGICPLTHRRPEILAALALKSPPSSGPRASPTASLSSVFLLISTLTVPASLPFLQHTRDSPTPGPSHWPFPVRSPVCSRPGSTWPAALVQFSHSTGNFLTFH